MRGLPEGFRDEIRTNVDVTLCFRDRAKLLFGWTLHLTVKTLCENEPGRLSGTSGIGIWRPAWWPRRQQQMVAWEAKEPDAKAT